MIYSLSGKLAAKKEGFVVIEVNGIGHKIFVSPKTYQELPATGQSLMLYSYLNVKEDALDLYGFLSENDLNFFSRLLTVSGVGPKSGLAVMAITSTNQLMAAVNEGDAELLTKASGIGRKTAERIILELKGKLLVLQSAETVKRMESDLDLEEALVGLGYSRQQAKRAINQLDPLIKGLELRLKAALKLLKK